MLKEKIVPLASQGEILPEDDEIVTTHHISVSVPNQASTSRTFIIQFGSLLPMEVVVEPPEDSPPPSEANRLLQDSKHKDKKVWTIVTSKKKTRASHFYPTNRQIKRSKGKVQAKEHFPRQAPYPKESSLDQGKPVYKMSENSHCFFNVCNYKDCLDDQEGMRYEDDQMSKRKKNKGKKESQQVLKKGIKQVIQK